MKDIVVLAGSTPWSVLSLCKCAYNYNAKAYSVCVKNKWGEKYAKSKYIHKSYDTTEENLDAFWNLFFQENRFAEKPILYVTNDYVCQIVNRNRKFYEEHFVLCMASSYIIDSFIDKNKASVEAEIHGLMVPKTMEVKNNSDLDEICSSFNFPVIVKPVTFRDHRNAGFKFKICNTKPELDSFVYNYLNRSIRIQCQEYIKGEDKDCVFYQFYRDKDGNITECMGEKTLQSNGIMTIGTTKYDERLSKMCREFLNSVDYVGIGGIEFKRFEGRYYFIEMSTRTEGFLAISDMAGVSIAKASWLSLNGKGGGGEKQEENIRYVVFIPWLLDSLHQHNVLFMFVNLLKIWFSPRSKFVGSFLDWNWSFKSNLKLL